MILSFTLCSNNYLAQAITLGKSLLEYNPNYKYIIGLVDTQETGIDYSKIPFEVLLTEKVGIDCFSEMALKYNIFELNTAVKPFYFRYLFNTYKPNSVIFLDPDIQVFAPFEELESELLNNDIVITPHFTKPINDNKCQSEEDFLNSGLYNLGFIAVKNSLVGKDMINWWAERLRSKAHIDFSQGMFTDQIWINFVPLFFTNVHILKHAGYNMAYWNLHERYLENSNHVIKDSVSYPLVFFHFSGYDPLKPDILSKYQNRFSFENRSDVVRLFNEYSKTIIENGYFEYNKYPCFYVVEKLKHDQSAYLRFKKSIPLYKRIIRGLLLRFIKVLKIDIDYYTK